MARTIDEKVVEMRFDNQNFESNVAQSMSTLDKLKSALNFSGVEKAFNGLSSAADSVNFNGLTGALDGVTEKFSAFEAVAVGALMNIGAKISDLAIQTAKELTVDQITAGFDKYAKKTEAVQMIMNATGQEIEEVSNQLERLNWYTDETSYDFAEMVASIGKFTAAGIDLETAVTSMQGIANWAGVSGANKAEANRAMYNISQALSTGYMQKIDWKSIENANMATKEFKEMVIQAGLALGALEEFDGKIGVVTDALWNAEKGVYEGGKLTFTNEWENGVNFSNMASTLSKGKWLTNEVLTAVLDMYGGFTNELSEVYDYLNESTDITTSQIIKLTEQWVNHTIDMDEAMAMTGKSAEELEKILSSLGREEYALGRKAFAAAQEAKTFREAIDATKDAVSTGFMNTFEQLFGNYEEAKVLWTDLANELWNIFASPISDLNDMLLAWNHIELPNGTVVKGRDVFIQSIKDIYHAIRSVIDPITEAWDNIFPSIDFRKLFELTQQFQKFTASLELSEEAGEAITTTFEGIFRVFSLISDVLKTGLLPFFKELIGFGKDMDGGLFDIFSEFGVWLNDLIDSVRGSDKFIDFLNRIRVAAGNVGKSLHDMFRPGDIVDVFRENGGGIGGAIAVLIEMLQDANGVLAGVAYAITGNNGIFDAIAQLNEKLSTTSEKVGTVIDTFERKFGKISAIFQPLVDAVKTIGGDFFKGLIMIFEDLGGAALDSVDGLNAWLDAANQYIKVSPKFALFVENVKEAVKAVSDFLVHMLSLKGAVQIFRDAGGGINGFFAVLDERVSYIVDSIFDAIQHLTGVDLHGVGDKIMLVLHTIGEGVLWLADTIAKAFGWENNPFGQMLETSSGALDTIKEKITSLFGKGEDGFKISTIFERIGGAFEAFWGIIQKVASPIASGLGVVGKVIEWLVEQLTQLSLNEVFKLIMVGELAYLIRNISFVLGGLSEVLEGFGLKLKAEAIKSIAASILMIAGAAILLATIPEERMTGVITSLAVAFGGLIGVLFASKFAKVDDVLKLPVFILAVSLALTSFAKAMVAISGAVEAFGSMDTKQLIQGVLSALGTMVVTMGTFVVALKTLGKNAGSALAAATALRSVGLAMIVLFAAVELFRLVDMDDVLNSLLKMVTLVGSVGTIAAVLNRFAGTKFADLGKSILEISEALILLSAALFIVGKIDDFWMSLLKLAAALAVIGGLASLISLASVALEKFSSSLMKLGAGLLFVSLGLVAFGLLSKLLGEHAEELIDAGIDLLILVIEKIAERTPELVSAITGLVTAILTEISNSLQNVDPEPFIHGAEFVGALILAIFGIKKMNITAKDLLKVGGLLVGIALLITEMGVLFYAMGKLAEITDAADQINEFGKVADAISGVFSLKFSILVASLVGIMAVMDKLGIGDRTVKENLTGNLKIFGLIAMVIGEVALLIEEMGLIFAAMGALNTWGGTVKKDENGETALIRRIKDFGDFATALGDVLIGPLGVMIAAFVGIIAMLDKLGFGKNSLKDNAGGSGKIFELIVQVIGEVALIIEAMGLIFAAMGALNTWGGTATKDANGDTALIRRIKDFGDFAEALADVLIGPLGILFAAFSTILIGLQKAGLGGSGFKATAGGSLSIFGEILVVIAEVSAVIEAMGLIFAAMGALSSWGGTAEKDENGQTALIRRVYDFGDFAEAIADVLGRVVGAFAGGVAGGFTEGVIQGWTDGIKYMAESFSELSDTFSSFDEGSLSGCKNFAAMLLILTGAEMVTGLGTLASLGTNLLGGVVIQSQMSSFGKAVKNFTDEISGLDDGAVAKAGILADVLSKLSDAIPETSRGLLGTLIEGKKDFGVFGVQIVKLGVGLKSFQEYTKDLDVGLVSKASSCVGIITALATEIPATTRSLWGMIAGESTTDFGEFGVQIVKLGVGLKSFQEYTKDIDAGLVGKAATCVSIVAALSQEIPVTDRSFFDWIAGEGKIDLGDFGNQMSKLGAGLKAFQESVTETDAAKIGAGVGSIRAIIKLKDPLGDGSVTLASIGKDFEAFGKSVKECFKDVSAYDEPITDISNAISNVVLKVFGSSDLKEQLRTAASDLVTEIQNGIVETISMEGGIKTQFADFITTLLSIIDDPTRHRSFYEAGKKLLNSMGNGLTYAENTGAVKTAFTAFIDELRVSIEEASEAFYNAGKKLLESIGSGLTNPENGDSIKSSFHSFLDELTYMISSDEIISQFTAAGQSLASAVAEGLGNQDTILQAQNIGTNISAGMAIGIASGSTQVVEATKKMASGVLKEARATLEINSPSEQFRLLGLFCDYGMANGIWDGIPDVVEKVHELGTRIVDGITNSELVDEMKNAGMFSAGAYADGLASQFEKILDIGNLLGENATDGMLGDLFDAFTAGQEVDKSFIEGLLSEYSDVYDAGADASEECIDGLLSKYGDSYDAGEYTISGYTEGILACYTDCVDAGDICGSGVVDGLASYGAGGSNVRYTKDAATSVVTVVSDSITDGTDDIRDSAIVMAEAWQDGFINGAEWDSFTDEVKAKLGDALEGLVGYTLSDDNVISRVTKAGEVVKVEDGPGVITFNGSEGTIRVNASNSVAGLNGSKVSSIYSDMATEAQASMERARQYSSNGGSSNSNDSLTNAVNGLRSDMATYNANVTNLQVVMDTGTVAGELTPNINRNLGKQSELSQRGVYKFG